MEFDAKNCRLEVANPFLEGADLHFGGCQFTFWRLPIYMLEAEIAANLLYRKGGKPCDPPAQPQTPIPKTIKYTKSSSKVGFWGYGKSSPKVGQK